jgi:hypothetical protein
LIDHGLVGAWIYLREQVPRVHGLTFSEVDAGDLTLDLGANNDGVVRYHSTDTAEVDWHVMLGDHPSDNWYRRRWSGRGCGWLQWASIREVQKTASRNWGDKQGSGDDGFLFHDRCNSRMKS